MTTGRRPSLRRRLMLNMLLPAAALALLVGVGGSFFIVRIVQTTHDRVLDASVLAIVERLGTDDDNEVTVDLPRVALGMLETRAQDSVYYTVTYDGALVTGYRDLPLVDDARLQPTTTVQPNGVYRGEPIRIAAQARRIYGKPDLALVEVAETLNGRHSLEYEMLIGLAVLETGLLGLVGLLAWHGIGRGLQPLTELSREIGQRAAPDAISLKPIDTTLVPEEALAPVLALNVLLDRLENAMAAVRRFTADASHQIRTPLAVLRMHLDLARREGPETPAGEASLDDVDSAARRLERLLAQLLTLARADDNAAADDAADATADLAAVAAQIVMERVPQAVARGIDVQFERPDEPVPVVGQDLLIGELIGNLLDNAIRYNRPQGKVVVRVVTDAGGRRLVIQDQGPGIPASQRGRVFERFHRLPRKEAPDGTGLGLAIVRALADRIGASVSLHDAPADSGLLVLARFRKPSRAAGTAVQRQPA